MKNLLKKSNNKQISWAVKCLIIIACCLFTLALAAIIAFDDHQISEEVVTTSSVVLNDDCQPSEENDTSSTRMDILKEMYHENSRDIIVAVDVLFNYGGSLVKSDIKTTYSYLSTYDVNTEYDYSDEKFDLEVDAFVYIFKDELMLDEVTKELVLKRQFILNEIKNMEE